MVYAVIDTNVFVAALLTKNSDSATLKVYEAIIDGLITPLYHRAILDEYRDVLCRPKFKFSKERVDAILSLIVKYGIEVFPKPTGEILVDMDDLIFYEVAMEKREDNSYLVTGNQKHYPVRDFIVTPAEIIEIVKGECVGF